MTFDRKDYSDADLLRLYEGLLLPRMIEEKMLILLRQGRVSKWFSGIGQEGIAVMRLFLLYSLLAGALLAAPSPVMAQVYYAPPVPKTTPTVADTVMAPELSPLGDNPALDPHAPPDDKVYTYVEQMPEFPGGHAALLKFLRQSYRYPTTKTAAPLATRLHLRFIVDKTGAVRDPEVLQGISPAHDAEALRIVRRLPRFQPGYQNGRPLNVYYSVPLILDAK